MFAKFDDHIDNKYTLHKQDLINIELKKKW